NRSLVGLVLACALVLAGPSSVRAETAAASATAAAAGDLGFDLFNDDKQQTPADKARLEQQTRALDRRVHRRRSLLTWHQGFGFATLGLLAATLVIGQLNYQDKFAPDGEYTQRYNSAHLDLGMATSAAFAV